MRDLWRKHLQEMAGGQDTSGIELVNLIRVIGNFYDSAMSQPPGFREISGPRLGILMRLMGEEDAGNRQGLNPTRLSHYQNVKKNTISSLLSGLEEQGLIERTIDPEDKRGFFIRITPAGRERITATMPLRIRRINQLTSELNADEKKQLIMLLEKLHRSIILFHHNTHQSKTGDSI